VTTYIAARSVDEAREFAQERGLPWGAVGGARYLRHPEMLLTVAPMKEDVLLLSPYLPTDVAADYRDHWKQRGVRGQEVEVFGRVGGPKIGTKFEPATSEEVAFLWTRRRVGDVDREIRWSTTTSRITIRPGVDDWIPPLLAEYRAAEDDDVALPAPRVDAVPDPEEPLAERVARLERELDLLRRGLGLMVVGITPGLKWIDTNLGASAAGKE
jgi:hypothetical protein